MLVPSVFSLKTEDHTINRLCLTYHRSWIRMTRAWQGQYSGSVHRQGNLRTTKHSDIPSPCPAISFCAAHRCTVPDPKFRHLHWQWPMASGRTSPHWCVYSCRSSGNLKDDKWIKEHLLLPASELWAGPCKSLVLSSQLRVATQYLMNGWV